MHPLYWIPPYAESLLDVGCNVGELLSEVRQRAPAIRLAGVDVNEKAVEVARERVPGAEFHCVSSERLPFTSESFDCLTCIEVLEHIPANARSPALREMHRVLKRGGRLVLRTPPAGAFAWLDAQNFRFRCPRLYARLIGRGLREAGYPDGSDGIVWHYHFTQRELLSLLGAGWELEGIRYGGFLLFPISDILRWPFYRLGWPRGGLYRALQRIADADYSLAYGLASYRILLALQRK